MARPTRPENRMDTGSIGRCAGGNPGKGGMVERLQAADRVLVIGGSGTGKTELLKRLATTGQGETIILDPHAGPDTWPRVDGVRVVGRGRDYAAIGAEVEKVVDLMGARYQAIADGHGADFPPVRLIIDEFTGLNRSSDISSPVQSLLIEGRKAGIRLLFAGQSDRVSALGIRGAGDLVDSFDAVCRLGRDYTGEIDGTRYAHPGPCRMVGYRPDTPPRHADTPEGTARHADTGPTETILTMHDAGASLSAICRAVYGTKGGRQARRVKDVLARHGRG